MPMIKVDTERCKGCKLCIVTCPKKLLRLSQDINSNGDLYCVQADAAQCTGCKFCAMICPDSAIEVYR